MPAYEQDQEFVDKNLSTILTKLQAQLPGNFKIRAGHVEVEYKIESESAEFFFKTGLTKKIFAAVGTSAGSGEYTINWVAFEAEGVINAILRDRGVVHAPGAKVNIYWIAIGE